MAYSLRTFAVNLGCQQASMPVMRKSRPPLPSSRRLPHSRAAAARRGHGKSVPALKAAPFGGDGRDVQFGPFRRRAFRVQLEARFQRFGLHRREQPHRKPHPRDPAHVVASGLVFEDMHHACDDGCFVHGFPRWGGKTGGGSFFQKWGTPTRSLPRTPHPQNFDWWGGGSSGAPSHQNRFSFGAAPGDVRQR